MILYFTGSGNNRFVADALADALEDEELSLNDLLHEGRAARFVSDAPYVVVAPIHTWCLLEVVSDLIERASFAGSRKIYFAATMAGDSGGAAVLCRKLAECTSMEFSGFAAVRMPGNCVYLDQMPTSSEAYATIRESLPRIRQIAELIRAGKPLPSKVMGPASALKSGNDMHAFYKAHVMSDRGYVVYDACISCGKCASVCPVGNIKLVGGRPQFKGSCCACIHHCPVSAIDIKGHTKKHGRYLCPDYHAYMKSQDSRSATASHR